jgi:hypothetical protein
MDPAAALLVLVVASGDRDPMPDAIERAARQSLGEGAGVVVRRVDELPTEARAAALGAEANASSVAEVAWGDAERRHARLHVRARSDGPWIDREIGFAESDAPGEQGRTIGFALASMLPEADPTRAALPPAAPPAAPESPPPEAPPRRWRGSLEAVALAAQAFGGNGGGLGGGVAGEMRLAPGLSARVEAALRSAQVSEAQGTVFTGTFGPGLAWWSQDATLASRFAFGARADALLVYQSVTHFSVVDASTETHARWLPGANAFVQASWLFTEGGAIVLAVGAESVFGSTDVYVHGGVVTQLPVARALLEIGIRARF